MRGKKDILRSSKRLRKKRLFKRLSFFVLIPVFILFSITALFSIPHFKIKKISIEGNSSLGQEKITTQISNYFNDKKFKIFPRDNILILSKKEMVNYLLKEFPRLKTVLLDKNFPDAIAVKVEERNNEAIFCPTEENCFFVDEDGFVFEPAPYFSAGVYLSFLNEATSTANSKPGFELLPQEQFRKLIDFKNLLTGENIKIKSILLKKENVYKLDTGEGWYILLNEKNDSRVSFENLKITLNQIKDKRKNLDYIDLRFGNKIFYKFRP